MKTRRFLAAVTAVVGSATVTTGAAPAGGQAAQATTRVSVAAGGAQATGGGVSFADVSADGLVVAFASSATNLVPGDTNGADDVFVRDSRNNETIRVSVATGGGQANGGSFFAAVSGDGGVVAFSSRATNLVAGDTNGESDVFVHDRRTGATTRVNVATGGAQAIDPASVGLLAPARPSLSADGRHVAFASRATNLVADDTNNQFDTFVHDRQNGETTRVSVNSAGAQATGGGSSTSATTSLSADGRRVAFVSGATNLVVGDTNASDDAFVHDRQSGQTTRVSVASDGSQATGGPTVSAVLSGDGSVVAFSSRATNLVPDDTNGQTDVFVHVRDGGGTTRVSAPLGGGQSSRASFGPALSGDGAVVAFDSESPELVAGDTNGTSDVFVLDRAARALERASVATDGAQAVGSSFNADLSADGRVVVFSSDAANLVPGDTNLTPDVFTRDRAPAAVPLASGYRLVASDGGVFAFGDARFLGSTGALRLAGPIVGMASTPTGAGYRLVASDGGVFAFGDARFLGSTGALRLAGPIVGMASTPTGAGYRLVASDGGVFAFGDARFLGSTGALRLAGPIVGMASTPTGAGYWLVASDGGVFAFGDARFLGSTGALRLAGPIVGMASTPTGAGYWLVAADGGVFAFGDARFLGSTGALRLARPIVGMASTPTGAGYWLVASDGGVFAFGDARFLGSTGALRLARPIVGAA